jgi:hypothetical protein
MVFTEMMAALSRRDVSEERFRCLGIEGMTREEAGGLLRHCLEAYDRAAEVWHTPLPFGDWDLMPGARGHMVDGVRDIFDRGYHREAVGWMTYVSWLSRAALKTDAPEEYETRWRPGFDRFFEVLGIGSIEPLRRKAVLAEELLGKVMDVAEFIMDGRAGAGAAGRGQR